MLFPKKTFALTAIALLLGACTNGMPDVTHHTGNGGGGSGVMEVAVDSTGAPILTGNEEPTRGGNSAGGTPIIDNGGNGEYTPAPVTQTVQDRPFEIKDDPKPAPAAEPEPTNMNFGEVSS
jgi:hypothetical protein